MKVFLYDGRAWVKYSGVQRRDGLHVTMNGSVTVFTDDLVQYRDWVSGTVILCVESVPLSDHAALERARRQIALSSIFNSGGDLMRYLQIGALVVPILVSLYTAISLSSLRSVSDNVTQLITMLEKSRLFQ